MFVANCVAKEDAVKFTMLLPIKIALSILVGSSINLQTVLAPFLFSSARERIRSLLTVVRAVSAEEKKPDKSIRINKIINCVTLGSKIPSPNFI